MKKIEKKCNLSSVYKEWEEQFEKNKFNHPTYNSSKNEFYWDVVMNLFHCQEGLCAYTEMRICNKKYLDDKIWVSGKYNLKAGKPEIAGQLEHFDRSLKPNKGWLWDNLFMVETNVNTKVKLISEVDVLHKPDSKGYDEFNLLEYNSKMNIFIANTSLNKVKQNRINKMIITLGLNFDPVKEQRRIYLEDKLKMIELKVEDWETINIEQFPTAFKMIKQQMLGNQYILIWSKIQNYI